jgi:hypothetical protein
MTPRFSCDLAGPVSNLPHFWEHTVGSGRAALALRADWQAQMRRAHDELGFGHVRFHSLLDDDMSTLIAAIKLAADAFNRTSLTSKAKSLTRRWPGVQRIGWPRSPHERR